MKLEETYNKKILTFFSNKKDIKTVENNYFINNYNYFFVLKFINTDIIKLTYNFILSQIHKFSHSPLNFSKI